MACVIFGAPVADPGAARPVTPRHRPQSRSYYRWAHTSRHLVFSRSATAMRTGRASSVDIASGVIVPLTPGKASSRSCRNWITKFPEEMLLQHNARNKRYFDMFSGQSRDRQERTGVRDNEYLGLITDSDFQLRLGSRLTADGTSEIFRAPS